MNNRDLAKSIAVTALSLLSSKDVDVESLTRQALRVANLRDNPYMRAWLTLQLLDLQDAGTDVERVREQLESSFPNRARSAEVALKVFEDFFLTRTLVDDPEKLYGAPIGDLQRVVELGEKAIVGSTPIKPKFMIAQRNNRQMLKRIVNRIQDYLMGIESEPEEASS